MGRFPKTQQKTAGGDFVITWGKKHLGQTLAVVAKENPAYITWMLRENMHVSRPALGASMRSMGLIREGVTSDAMPVVSLEQQAKRHRVREAVSKEHSTEAHKRYVRPHQRTTEYSNQVQRSRQAQDHSLLDFMRADPMTLTQWMVDCGLFDRLQGTDCPFGPQCTTPTSASCVLVT